VITIDLGVVGANWRALKDLVAPAACAAVVKANAYGLGADRVIPALTNAGCEVFFVATVTEAKKTRNLAPQSTIYVLDGLLPDAAGAMLDCNGWPVLSSLQEAREWGKHASAQGPDISLPCALHVDTGLNRLGFDARDLQALAADMHLLGRLDVKLVMSHMACADEPGHPMNETQRSVFDGLQPLLPSVAASLAASDGLMLGASYHYDLVRPGYALYGGQAVSGQTTPVQPAVQVYARVLQVRDVAPSQTVGYSAAFSPTRPSRVATIAAGYADGIFRHASVSTPTPRDTPETTEPAPCVAIGARTAPLIGRVSMDLITVDVTDFEDQPVERGDWAEIIGPNLTIEEVGTVSGTIGYEVLTRLGQRFHRIYLNNNS